MVLNATGCYEDPCACACSVYQAPSLPLGGAGNEDAAGALASSSNRVYDSIRLPHIFLGSPSACACNVYQSLSPPLERKGHEATSFSELH